MKRDFKYIIKRIIIGVAISLILGFIGKNNVFADTIANSYCYERNTVNSTNYNVIECTSQNIDNAPNYNIGIKTTPVGDDVFTFIDFYNSYYSYFTFGFENVENGDLFLYENEIPTSIASNYSQFGFQNGVFYMFNNNDITDPPGSYGDYLSQSDKWVLYITEDYSRAYELVNNNIAYINYSYTPTLYHVNDYYFVRFRTKNDYNFYDMFGGIQPTWVFNRLNGDDVFSDLDPVIHYFDSNGDLIGEIVQTEESFNLPFIDDYWQQGFIDGGDTFTDDTCSNGGVCFGNIQALIDFIKMPFNFLKGLNRNNCSPITITIPFVNSNISLPCLSSTFSSALGSFYNIIFLIFTGLYAYRITIRNIDTITDVFDPTDDKLEVLAL